VPNDKNTFFNLVFTNTLTLKLGRLHKAFEIEMWVCCCEFEAMESRTQRYMFRMADL
jgi:hypothetical protein